ncbi:MAG: hypothetical protein ABIP97_08230, partial [Chthoniobacterales bacterium]
MIDFGTPFDSALQRTKSILFGPFDFGKWLALAFTAWMAQCSAGLISLVQTFGNPGHQPWNGPPSSVSHIAPSSVPNHPPSLIDIYRTVFADQFNTGGLIFVGIMLVFGVVLAWVAMRGKFMFLDNLVFNRAEIKAPWRKFRRQANSLFLINILIGFIFLVGMVIFVGLCISSSVLRGHIAVAMTLISALVLLLVVILPAWIFTILYNAFAVPVMYCTGCLAREALGRVWRMI